MHADSDPATATPHVPPRPAAPGRSAAPVIRPAEPDDAFPITAIFAHYVVSTLVTFREEPLTTTEWRRKMADTAAHGLPFLVVEMNGAVAGFAYAGPWRPQPAYRHTVENSIYLAPDRTGLGLGRALLTALVEGCERAGVRQIVAVIADSGSDASPALHRRLGFTEAGRLRAVGHKHGRWLDTVLMQRDLATIAERPGGLTVPEGALGPEGPSTEHH
ncbi:GNAT family N-acetyltransferase [Streptomyces sp. RFCAC02]|uniref:GNAT family N-acetyltransferase n=1 Tax=Streptomyces sp. RFCAC02 TaxID=2499143 RepID=UPI001021F7ED|nr:GNAT family N-acetyltransferase [Streptomyces sp. RFCAC02]